MENLVWNKVRAREENITINKIKKIKQKYKNLNK
jgi:hypothetical protein